MAASIISIQQLLVNPNTFAIPKQLQLLAQKTITQLNVGIHAAKKLHNNFEFNQFKSYTPGDDLRLVDWKTFGKTKKLYIKQAPKINNVSVHLIPDVSKSMLYEEGGISKINFTIYLFASLCNLVMQQQDDLFFFNTKKKLNLKEALHFLTRTELVNKWTNNQQQYYQSINNNKKKLIIYCSDFYEYNNEMIEWLNLAAVRKNEVIVFYITGKQERVFDFKNANHIKDLETGQTTILNKQIKESAKTYFQNRKNYLKNVFTKNKINYVELSMNELPVNALSKFLLIRSKIANVI